MFHGRQALFQTGETCFYLLIQVAEIRAEAAEPRFLRSHLGMESGKQRRNGAFDSLLETAEAELYELFELVHSGCESCHICFEGSNILFERSHILLEGSNILFERTHILFGCRFGQVHYQILPQARYLTSGIFSLDHAVPILGCDLPGCGAGAAVILAPVATAAGSGPAAVARKREIKTEA